MTQHPADTVRAVVDVLEPWLASASDTRLVHIAGEILDAIVEDPVATRHQDGTVTLQWPSTAGHAALVSRELLVADANRVRAGSEPYPTEPVELTAGQWWGMLLDLEPDARRKALEQIRRAAQDGNACLLFRHPERVEQAEARVRALEAEVDTLRRTLAALRGPLAPLVDRTPTPTPQTPTAVLEVPAGTSDEHLDHVRAHVSPGTLVRRIGDA